MKSESIKTILIVAILLIFVVLIILQIIKQTDENGNVCVLKDEFISHIEQQSKEHRNFCLEKNMSPIYPEIKAKDCRGYCYQSSCFLFFCSCDIDMNKEVWCSENQEIKRFQLNERLD